ncbi:uncharacterized protein LOC110981553 [Acanthaster planci]|uniref:Uncharacterized protein LOC110981553 n=1 Tax=Acanthaster planci TaxID=133434 RepID=A0A8B7YNM2_ACAPL|nr:uncharacterized protein LOC110981553 [Acanthaster planci]XP_022094867.1 uncharacterized protein LOC110981553 [Acanthaster planci]XP_022094868.1 uncharacterized protein LOC110981553 [Acanthaster planci]XP_022094869.1 uncharacterized protein LOC110981553 [Acanthaster planci]XP_022094870.1 uncharacterized protein LOC110981553 [Acanthaster planci]XP_022094871.1 uncharacterized protein LOC110981553 [Acanthaster planci]XP_022094872.1 uncharacterized protein LOC110981553 [Acanthaster planci]XP_0
MLTARMAKKSSLAKQVRDQDTPSQQIESSATLEHTEICEMEVPFLLHMDTGDEARSSVEHVMDDVQFPDGTMCDSETFIPLPALCAKEPGSSERNCCACTANETQSTYPEPGYTLVCNHIPADSTCRPQSCQGNANMCTFAVKNRILLDTPKSRDGAVRHAQEVPLSCFLPSSDDWQNMKHRMCLILKCILRDHFLYLQNMKCSAYVRHKYSLTTRRISEIVRLGEQENMSTSTPGAVHALESLLQFVPSQGDDLHPVVCFGDKHSVKQMVHTKHSRSTEASAAAKLEGLVLCPQDLHRRGVLLKDTIDRFFKKESASDPGTLCHLKKHFGYGPVKKITKAMNKTDPSELQHDICLMLLFVVRLNTRVTCENDSWFHKLKCRAFSPIARTALACDTHLPLPDRLSPDLLVKSVL